MSEGKKSRRSTPGLGRSAPLLAVLLALLAYGGAIELVQRQLPNRSGEWADLGADAIGIGLGALLALGWLQVRGAGRSEAKA